MSIPLDDLLNLVGTLDDSGTTDGPSARLRTYLRTKVTEVGTLRDYVEACLRNSGPQYNRTLQDLVNRLGEMLGFEVQYGRYAGKQGEIGFDGHWRSPAGAHIVVEVKTTDAYAIQTATLLNYINELVSAGRIPPDSRFLGLYVVGRPDASLKQLENAVVAEKRSGELRIASVDSMLSLAELAMQYEMDHEAVTCLLFPSGPRIDPIVDLMASLVAQEMGRDASAPALATPSTGAPAAAPSPAVVAPPESVRYFLTPVRWKGRKSPMEQVGRLLKAGKYAYGERTPGRRDLRPGHWICFYASGLGVFAHAKVLSEPVRDPLPKLTNDPDSYPWTFDIGELRVYEDKPIELTRDVRGQLSSFAGLDLDRPWGWYVTSSREVTAADFAVLTGQNAGAGG